MLDIIMRNVGDSFPVDIFDIDKFAESQINKYSQLMDGIHAVDIKLWVAFGKPFSLGIFKGLFKGKIISCHLAQDEVAGPVDNTVQAFKAVSGQAVCDGIDERCAGTDGRFRC